MKRTGLASILGSYMSAAAAIGVLYAGTSACIHAQVRFEIRAVESITLKDHQVLIGDKNGSPAMLAGELRIPKPGTDKLPAVILVHGSGGIGPAHDRWAQEINSVGVAVFILDSFSGRGIVNTITDQAQLESLAMMVDAYRALATLARHPRIDPSRIVVMGFSKGAVAALYSSNDRFRKMYGPLDVQFAAHIGLYAPCYVTYRDDDKTTGKPIRLFHGIADDWVPIEPCRSYVERLNKSGADVALAEYAGAYHAYDSNTLPLSVLIRRTVSCPSIEPTRVERRRPKLGASEWSTVTKLANRTARTAFEKAAAAIQLCFPARHDDVRSWNKGIQC